MHSFQKNFFDDEIFAPIFFVVLLDCCFFSVFSEVAARTFRKSNCTTIFHSVSYSVVKEHFRAAFLDLFNHSYLLAESFNPLYWIAEKTPKN